jgi:hypothetical protein
MNVTKKEKALFRAMFGGQVYRSTRQEQLSYMTEKCNIQNKKFSMVENRHYLAGRAGDYS